MCLQFLPGQLFLGLAEAEQLSRVLRLRRDGAFELFDELLQFILVAAHRLITHLVGLILELGHLLVPELVELVELIHVRLLNLAALVRVTIAHLRLVLHLQLLLQLLQTPLGLLCLDVLATLLAALLMFVQDLSKGCDGQITRTCIPRGLLSEVGDLSRSSWQNQVSKKWIYQRYSFS